MIKEEAIVIADDSTTNGRISVRIDRKSACESCQMKAGCGQKLVNDSSQRKCIEFELDNEFDVQVGDYVTLAVPEKTFLQASLVMYVLPLVLMILCAVLAESYLALNDAATLLASICGFGLGLYLARRFASEHKSDPDFQPHIVAVDRAID
ncbi:MULTISPECIES: SoxR reducing system RseC family protein [unclassified Oleiphilus]|jgi:sigma-E factor negative regulatory protein RseC|uniref:SoxR reducing system RseC family protein n=2 Tax=Oleiphilus TaxID=141450 RepID=UPI0007C2EC1E|nr:MULTISPECIES: SoxR reducing system RseC family protein [unclassified Oleiphilus]KZY45318.1 hypothetical protein A3732_10560 [Oleiphilus sp. HI0050]KZZ31811.1 hypothetical protein A3756_00665 [Oleiphilus sp. HI0086]KZZ32538.1 hypothetical protein A3757_04665 [Oleiphilus sp. HI0117]KZZ58558.1 hypothetical protein A3761_05955 [Oleiphilus sp. HI0123]